MTIAAVEKDLGQLTTSATTDPNAPVIRAWQVGRLASAQVVVGTTEPPSPSRRQLADSGGCCDCVMTGLGEQPHHWWRILAVDAPASLELDDGSTDEHGNPNDELPVMMLRPT